MSRIRAYGGLVFLSLCLLLPACSRDENPVSPFPPVDPTAMPSFVRSWSAVGASSADLEYPGTMTVGPNGNLLVVASTHRRIFEYSRMGELVSTWHIEVGGVTFSPMHVLYKNDRFYVHAFSTILVFDKERELLASWGTRYPQDNEIACTGLAVDVEGCVYELKYHREMVVKYSSEGVFVTEWRTVGPSPGIDSWPSGIAISQSGRVYITDTLNHRILVFSTDGTYLLAMGTEGSEPGQFLWPTGITIGDDGYLYVVDRINFRIQKLNEAGGSLGSFISRLPDNSETPICITTSRRNFFVNHMLANKIRWFAY